MCMRLMAAGTPSLPLTTQRIILFPTASTALHPASVHRGSDARTLRHEAAAHGSIARESGRTGGALELDTVHGQALRFGLVSNR
jgi:hypothetical protein